MMAMLRDSDECHEQQMPDPRWYLMAPGVDPPHQRRGYGRALVRSGIQRASGDNKPIYLEAETDAIATFYDKLEFEVLGEMTIEAIHMPFSLMIHQPETAPSLIGHTGARMCRRGRPLRCGESRGGGRPTRDRWSSFREVRRTVLSAAGVPTV